jgi:hypothetical protein
MIANRTTLYEILIISALKVYRSRYESNLLYALSLRESITQIISPERLSMLGDISSGVGRSCFERQRKRGKTWVTHSFDIKRGGFVEIERERRRPGVHGGVARHVAPVSLTTILS